MTGFADTQGKTSSVATEPEFVMATTRNNNVTDFFIQYSWMNVALMIFFNTLYSFADPGDIIESQAFRLTWVWNQDGSGAKCRTK